MDQLQENETPPAEKVVGFCDDIDCLRSAMQVAGFGIWEVRLSDYRIVWDDACRRIFGIASDQELSYNEILALIYPDDTDRLRAAVRTALGGTGNGQFDLQFRTVGKDDGKLRWVHFSGKTFSNEQGMLIRFGGIAQDVSHVVQATQQALEAQRLSDMALQSAGAGSFRVHLGTDHIEYSPALAKIYTGDDTTAIDRKLLGTHIHPDDRAARLAAYREAEHTGKLFYEARTVWNDGSIHWIEARGTYVSGPDGKRAVLAGVVQDITSRKLEHLAVEQREQELFDSFYQAPVGIAIIGKDKLTFRVANGFYSRLTGRLPEQLIGKPLLDALPELVGQGFDEILNRVIETGESFSQLEAPVRFIRNGKFETIYVDFVYQAMHDPRGKASNVLVVVTDVSNQVQSRRQIAASEAKFRSLIEEAPFATALYVGDDLIIDTANPEMIQLWGKTPAVIGQPLERALPELKGQPFLGLLRQIMETGETHHARSAPADLVVNGTLQRFWFSYTYKPLYDENGLVYAILNMALDVTDEVLARAALEEATAARANAIELAGLGTWRFDLQTGMISLSDRMKDWFGLVAANGKLPDAIDAIVPNDRERVLQALAEAIRPGAAIFNEEYRIRSLSTGQHRVIHAQGRLIPDSTGTPVRLDGTARDVTLERELQLALERQVQERTEELAVINEELRTTNEELQTANEELAEANDRLVHSNEELAQYAYVASHDLQEPLRKIRVFSGMLDESASLEPAERSLVGKISHSATRMALLIKDLLEFSKLLNSDAIWQPVELTQVVRAIDSDFELVLAEKHGIISIGTLPRIEAVGLQMNQLFYNLIGNALKFVNAGVPPRISVQATRISHEAAAVHIGKLLPFADYYQISVADNGIGFDVQYTEQIFEVFKRLHGRDAYPGSGIGLALCRRIVANHNGALYAESEPDKGSVFHVILPDMQEDLAGTPPDTINW